MLACLVRCLPLVPWPFSHLVSTIEPLKTPTTSFCIAVHSITKPSYQDQVLHLVQQWCVFAKTFLFCSICKTSQNCLALQYSASQKIEKIVSEMFNRIMEVLNALNVVKVLRIFERLKGLKFESILKLLVTF